MFSRKDGIFIQAPPLAVYDYVSDLTRHPEWAKQKMEMMVEGEKIAPETAFTTHISFMGKVPGKGRVVEMQSPGKFSYECKDSSGTYLWTMDAQPEGSGTKLTYSFDRLAAPLYFKLLQGVVFYPIFGRGMMSTALANIKRNVEASVGAKS